MPEAEPRVSRRQRRQADPAAKLAADPAADAAPGRYLVGALGLLVGTLVLALGVGLTFGIGWALMVVGALLLAFGANQAYG